MVSQHFCNYKDAFRLQFLLVGSNEKLDALRRLGRALQRNEWSDKDINLLLSPQNAHLLWRFLQVLKGQARIVRAPSWEPSSPSMFPGPSMLFPGA